MQKIIIFRTSHRPWTEISLVVLGGLALGVLTLLGQSVLPGNWNTLVNSGAIWLLAAFLLSSHLPADGWAALAGLGMLLVTVAAYFAAAQFLFGIDVNLGGMLFWGGIALVGGPLFGLAGHWWRDDRQLRRVVAMAALGGVFGAEGLYYLLVLPDQKAASGWVMLAAGILLPLILGRSARDRLLALLVLPAPLLLGLGVYWLINTHVF